MKGKKINLERGKVSISTTSRENTKPLKETWSEREAICPLKDERKIRREGTRGQNMRNGWRLEKKSRFLGWHPNIEKTDSLWRNADCKPEPGAGSTRECGAKKSKVEEALLPQLHGKILRAKNNAEKTKLADTPL